MKRLKKYFFFMSLMVVGTIFALTFIQKDNGLELSEENKYTVTYGVNEIPDNLKTISCLSTRECDIICALSKEIVSADKDNKIIPVLCSEINISDDKIQYEFKIRDNVYWSDKTKITSDDIVTFFMELLKEEDEKNIEPLLNIYGAKEFINKTTTFMSGVAIKAKGDLVIIRLNSPDNNFLYELTKPQYRLRRNIVMWENMYRNYNALVYSGDYSVQDINSEKLILKAVDNKQDKNSTIEFLKDENNELSMAAFEIKERDMVLNPPESEIERFSKVNKIATMPIKNAAYIYVNNRNNSVPVNVRRIIYNKIYEALKSQYTDNTKEYELAECCYFREDKSNLTAIQARKVNMNSVSKWDEPEVLTIIAADTEENRNLCKKITEWFKNNTKIVLKCSYVKDEINDEELKNRYDIVLINAQCDVNNKKELYKNFNEYLSQAQKDLLNGGEEDYWLFEESMFNNYDILPLVFFNENIVYGEDINNLNVDKNGNIDFTSIN